MKIDKKDKTEKLLSLWRQLEYTMSHYEDWYMPPIFTILMKTENTSENEDHEATGYYPIGFSEDQLKTQYGIDLHAEAFKNLRNSLFEPVYKKLSKIKPDYEKSKKGDIILQIKEFEVSEAGDDENFLVTMKYVLHVHKKRENNMKINRTDETLPEEEQEVLYWLKPFEKWFIGRFDGEWHFYSRHGFCDGHDAPYWIDEKELPDPRESE